VNGYPTVAVRERAAKAGVAIVEKPFLETILIDRIRDPFFRWCGAGELISCP
jgi:hypothetical protein